jgi:tRNA 2-selenouridine synthase
MANILSIEDFLKQAERTVVIDVRTSAEYEQGHIVGAINLPLFTNEERKIVGTLYKQTNRQAAILKGLELIGPKLSTLVEQAIEIKHTNSKSEINSNTFLIHCWRGGMRSASMAWLLSLYGFKCYTLRGGYKTYRNYVLNSFSEKKQFIVLGGKTGSGKTLVLHQLAKYGEQIIDLEKLAHHKGSSFGAFGEQKQFTQEQFENELSNALTKVDASKICWVEDESRKIGVNVLPENLWEQLRTVQVFYLDVATQARINYLVKEYGKFTKEELLAATNRIGKRIGGLQLKVAQQAIETNDLKTACEISLTYYDKSYQYGLTQRSQTQIRSFAFTEIDSETIAHLLIKNK